MSRLRAFLCFVLLAGCLGAGLPACAQHGGGGHGGGGGGMGSGGGIPGGGMGPGFSPGGSMNPGGNYGRNNGSGNATRRPESAGSVGGLRSRTQLGLLGRWWDDKHVAKDLRLRPEQKQRMDSVFETSRPALLKSFQDYQQTQSRLEDMYRSRSLDENTLYAQIDKVSQARAELGKVYTHYMLQIRSEMDTDQLTRLDEATKKQ